MSIIITNKSIKNRTRNLLTWRAMPQPTAGQRAPHHFMKTC
jgi:hypothetical protein